MLIFEVLAEISLAVQFIQTLMRDNELGNILHDSHEGSIAGSIEIVDITNAGATMHLICEDQYQNEVENYLKKKKSDALISGYAVLPSQNNFITIPCKLQVDAISSLLTTNDASDLLHELGITSKKAAIASTQSAKPSETITDSALPFSSK